LLAGLTDQLSLSSRRGWYVKFGLHPRVYCDYKLLYSLWQTETAFIFSLTNRPTDSCVNISFLYFGGFFSYSWC
jgi:hypothetical protein